MCAISMRKKITAPLRNPKSLLQKPMIPPQRKHPAFCPKKEAYHWPSWQAVAPWAAKERLRSSVGAKKAIPSPEARAAHLPRAKSHPSITLSSWQGRVKGVRAASCLTLAILSWALQSRDAFPQRKQTLEVAVSGTKSALRISMPASQQICSAWLALQILSKITPEKSA